MGVEPPIKQKFQGEIFQENGLVIIEHYFLCNIQTFSPPLYVHYTVPTME